MHLDGESPHLLHLHGPVTRLGSASPVVGSSRVLQYGVPDWTTLEWSDKF